MKHFFRVVFLVVVFQANVVAQNSRTDSLKQLLEKSAPDSNRVNLLQQLAQAYYFSKPDTSLFYSLQALSMAKNLKMAVAEIEALNFSGEVLRVMGDYPASLKAQFEALKLSRKLNDRKGEANSLGYIGFTYTQFGEYKLGLQYLLPSIIISREVNNKINYTFDLTNVGYAYDLLNMPDSALYYQLKAGEAYTGLTNGPLKSLILVRLGNAYASKGQLDSAMSIYYRSMENCYRLSDKVNLCKVQGKIASLFAREIKYDSSIHYARLAFENANLSKQRLEVMESSILLSSLYRDQFHNADSALFYQDWVIAMKDSLYGPQKFKQFQRLILEEQEKQQKAAQEQQQYRNKVRYIILFIILAVFLIISFLLLRNNRLKQKAKLKVEAAYNELKETQQQLIQREKMASLGELTAGIAHEIQNPLNFVNNFAEINNELIKELKEELAIGNRQQAIEIADTIKENSEKINQHGKRADGIVKGMLQHSQKSIGVKELTNINSLAEEYLRLTYHSFQSKHEGFSCELKLHFDSHIQLVNIIPQDVGRVLLNLYNNAFWAVNERNVEVVKRKGGEVYEPIVSVSTKKTGDKILISIKDNGNGIPDNIKDKIFQPFFTTKPTGSGTGLGLSLSYDILKAHGGSIDVVTYYRKPGEISAEPRGKVETKEARPDDPVGRGEGTTFIIQLPALA
ncbi:MAG: ATP-binding protein [Saprospiraceae bacterium]